jgi:hypothetical protein
MRLPTGEDALSTAADETEILRCSERPRHLRDDHLPWNGHLEGDGQNNHIQPRPDLGGSGRLANSSEDNRVRLTSGASQGLLPWQSWSMRLVRVLYVEKWSRTIAARLLSSAFEGTHSLQHTTLRAQKFSLSGSKLDDGPAGSVEGGVPLRGIVSSRGVHRDQSWDFKPGGGALLQQARDSRAVDQGRQGRGRDDAAFLSPLSRQRGAAMAEPHRL